MIQTINPNEKFIFIGELSQSSDWKHTKYTSKNEGTINLQLLEIIYDKMMTQQRILLG